MTTEPAAGPAAEPTLERTAPRAVDDCPPPRSERVDLREAWKYLGSLAMIRRADDLLEETELRSKILTARNMQWASTRFLEAAVFGLLDEGVAPDEVAELTGHPADSIRDDVDQDRKARIRRDYSVAYYERHPDRTPNQWYGVEDGDPELPEMPIGVRTREVQR
ncbi:hypothetical protein ACFV9C_44395 [Kribbella sp. NPDC059898]|uniref:hypothetical protein n=1 Tax=Kribbella sp. NPDC059898 TaxID=3346995 RepID=UPI003663445B